MNKVILIGRLTRDVELRYTAKGTPVAQFSLAVNRRGKQADGQTTDFLNIVAWGSIGENASKYLSKGSQAGVSGRLQTRNYQNNDGAKRTVTEVVADEIEFLTAKRTDAKESERQQDLSDFEPLEDDDDLPF